MAALLASTVANWLSVRLTCAVLTGVKKKKDITVTKRRSLESTKLER